MNKRQFIAGRRDAWRRFDALLQQIDRRGLRRLTTAETTEFSRLFRELSFDLSLVRSRTWGRGLVSYLNDLSSRGHNAFYSAPPGNLGHLWRFLASGFPRTFRKNIGYFTVAAALFFVPLALTWALVQTQPSLGLRILSAEQLKQVAEMYADEGPPARREKDGSSDSFGDERAMMFGFYIRNNVSIALDAFGRGILFGIGTVYTLLANGIAIGAIAGYIISQGHAARFLSFVVTHGSFELTAIAVAGGAGLMLGDALLHPGQRTRLESLRDRGLEAVQIASGAAAMLVIAAVIEAFWSPASVPVAAKYAVGAVFWVLVVVYLATAGRWERSL
ncbi:MAG: stage II sporulation protein M [Planctomycetaceae bacterium]